MSADARVLYVAHGDVGGTIAAAVERVEADVVEAVDGTDALKRLAHEPVDLVVVPAALPDVSVEAILRRVGVEGEAGAPVVVGDATGARGPMIQLPADVSAGALADRLRRTLRDRALGEALDRHERLEDAFGRIAAASAEADGRLAVERAVHEELAATRAFRSLWVGRLDGDAIEFVVPVRHRVPVDEAGAFVGGADRTAVPRAIEARSVTQTRAATGDARLSGVEGFVTTAVPLVDGERTWGVVVVSTDPDEAPDGAERSLLARIGRVVGAALTRLASDGADRSEELVGVFAHELRNPLQTATLSLEAARDDGDEESFERLEDALETMSSVVDATVAMARGRVGERESTDLHELAVSVWRTVREPPAELVIAQPVTVEADPALIERLLANLLGNAVRHAGPDVSVRIGTLPDGRGFYLEDDGPGIPPSERERVFEWGHTTDVDGLGAGLGVAAEIVEAHGWEIAATEGSEGGARFEVETVEADAEELAALFERP